ncbi:UPF0149 family protein [Sphingomonas sp.]|uniref:UPF0149 family protein n=1 Tax=Sphingomonas sp. TaxID=28214 RepID=UPI003AFF9E86
MVLDDPFTVLDDALADLPLDKPMLLTELDGFLTRLLVSPELIMPGEWLRPSGVPRTRPRVSR